MVRRKRKKKVVNNSKGTACTTKDGTKVKSKLERYCYDYLKEEGLSFRYEPTRYVLFPKGYKYPEELCYEKYTGKIKEKKGLLQSVTTIRGITYTPDFVGLYKGKEWVIETKGHPTPAFKIKWKLFKELFLHNYKKEAPLLLMPGTQKEIRQAVNIIKHGYLESIKIIEQSKKAPKSVKTIPRRNKKS